MRSRDRNFKRQIEESLVRLSDLCESATVSDDLRVLQFASRVQSTICPLIHYGGLPDTSQGKAAT